MKFVEILASYLPSLIVEHIKDHDTTVDPPHKQRCVRAQTARPTHARGTQPRSGAHDAWTWARRLDGPGRADGRETHPPGRIR